MTDQPTGLSGEEANSAVFDAHMAAEFVERDIEEDPTAAADMRSRAAAAGLHPSGIPVIDFRGRIILGFDRSALEEAIRETTPGGGGITI